MKPALNSRDFLLDDLFIYWRLNQTKELDDFWRKFLDENNALEEEFNKALREFDSIWDTTTLPPFDETLLKQQLTDRIEHFVKKKRRLYFVRSSAAAILIIALVSTIFFITTHEGDNIPQIITTGKVMPEDCVRLITGENQVEIDNNAILDISKKRNSAVVKSSSAQDEIELMVNQSNKLIVPFGTRSSLVLSDGSTIYLNSGTEITFPTSFAADKREISVEGEMYIDVVQQHDKPFIVHTLNSSISVLGTSFNVSSYADEENETIVLVKGAVEIVSGDKTLLLAPNEMACVTGEGISREKVDVNEFVSWKNGYMQLNKNSLETVLKKIGRYYNIDFRYDAELGLDEKTCSGKLFLSENLEEVLEAFSNMTVLTFTSDGESTFFIKQ